MFYSSCLHEVLPVKSGYRITLTYDLVLEEVEVKPNSLVKIPDIEGYGYLYGSMKSSVDRYPDLLPFDPTDIC